MTRHLDSTLKRDDWDILILHYLGLDHIGHISGPHSSLIQPKLMEMDDILKKIHSALISKVTLSKYCFNTAFYFCKIWFTASSIILWFICIMKICCSIFFYCCSQLINLSLIKLICSSSPA